MNAPTLPITAIVVSYQSSSFLPDCLTALLQAHLASILVVDNASTDLSAHIAAGFPGVTLIRHAANLGFAAAANAGIRASTTPFVLLMNPDVVLLAGLPALLDELNHPSVAAAAGMLTHLDGSPQTGFLLRRFPTLASQTFEVTAINALWPSNPINRRYRCLDVDPFLPQDVEQPPAAMLLIRRDAWAAIGGFDESFFPAWFEDVDFCQRLAASGFRIRYQPACRARHAGGHSFRHLPWDARQKYWYANLLRHASKHFSVSAFRALCVAVLVGTLLRTAAEGILRFRLGALPVFASVMRCAFRSLFRGRFC